MTERGRESDRGRDRDNQTDRQKQKHREPALKISKISKTNPLIIFIKQSLSVMYVAADSHNLMNVTVSGYTE